MRYSHFLIETWFQASVMETKLSFMPDKLTLFSKSQAYLPWVLSTLYICGIHFPRIFTQNLSLGGIIFTLYLDFWLRCILLRSIVLMEIGVDSDNVPLNLMSVCSEKCSHLLPPIYSQNSKIKMDSWNTKNEIFTVCTVTQMMMHSNRLY